MHARLTAAGLDEISAKLDSEIRLDLDDGIRLFECPDLLAVGWLANRERERRHGDRTFFNHNRLIQFKSRDIVECDLFYADTAVKYI